MLCAKPLIGEEPLWLYCPTFVGRRQSCTPEDNLAHMISVLSKWFEPVLVQKADEHVLYDYSVVECEVDTLIRAAPE